MTEKTQRKKLRILAAGDIHGDSRLAEKLAEQAKRENVDFVILAGDLTFADQSTKNIIGPFTRAKKKVLLIPGNHETIATADFLAEMYPETKNIHGYSIKAGDVGIFGAGSANIGLFQVNDKEIYDLLKRGWDNIKGLDKKIMVTHVHPADSKMEKFSQFFEGSKGVTRAIKKLKPDIAICSHVHEAEGIEEKIGSTRVINVGRKGKIIEL